jgi:hypothetical protein
MSSPAEEARVIDQILQALYDSTLGEAMREGALLFPVVETVHVIGLVLVLGSISVLDLRLLGWSSSERALTRVIRDALPPTLVGFAIAAISGFLLFASNAVAYAHNGPFQWKIALLALAGVNALVFHRWVEPRIADWDRAPSTPGYARALGAGSLLIWVAVTAFGRWIGFTVNAIG